MEKPTRVIIADDHPAIVRAVREVLEPLRDFQVVGMVERGRDLEEAVRESRPDLLVLDLEMEEAFAPSEAVSHLQALYPNLRVLVFSGHADPERVREMFGVGADGYLHKVEPVDVLVEAMRAVAAGESWVSPRLARAFVDGYWQGEETLPEHERAVLQGVADGETMEQIAEKLNVARRTAQGYLYETMASLNARTRAAAIAEAMRRGFIE